jgi:hypothetical protein
MITERMFEDAAKALLPNFIKLFDNYYALDAHGLMGGGWRISYVNPAHPDYNKRLSLDQMWDDPFDCLKAMDHSLNSSFHQVVSQDVYNDSLRDSAQELFEK